jgi:hypothetical protein
MILHAGVALGATLIALAGVLAILQYRDKVCLSCKSLLKFFFLFIFRKRMIENEKCNHKDFIMMLYNFK